MRASCSEPAHFSDEHYSRSFLLPIDSSDILEDIAATSLSSVPSVDSTAIAGRLAEGSWQVSMLLKKVLTCQRRI